MKTVLYLIQASAGLPKIYECLKKRSYILLSYKEDTSDTTIYAPDTTWAGGRNRLYQYVKDNSLLYDYYVFMDEDVVLRKTNSILIPNVSYSRHCSMKHAYSHVSSSSLRLKWPLRALFNRHFCQPEEQEAGFYNFEESLKLGYPIMTMKLYDYNIVKGDRYAKFLAELPEEIRQKGLENLNWPFQTIDWLDGILNALSQEVFFANTVLPYTEKYDAVSWWVSHMAFFIKANHYYPNQIIQNNQYTILNTQASDYPRLPQNSRLLYFKMLAQVYTEICAELGIDKIQFSVGKEIKPHIPLKAQVKSRFMSKGRFFAKFILPAIILVRMVKTYKYFKKMLCRQ